MRIASFAIALFCSVAALPARAQSDQPVVVELFTSQGCSSCPPADALMRKLSLRDDVIGLALHVDYWDYIGWKDEYGDPAFTKRQKGYAHTGGRNMVYTPQMIVNGQQDVVGARAMELVDLINQHKQAPKLVALQATRAGESVTITLKPLNGDVAGAGPYDVQLVRYTPLRQAHITRGELAGRDLEYVNIVDDWTVLGQWDGKTATELRASISGERPVVILVQKPDYGAILAAARIE